MSTCILGRGKLGTALHQALRAAGEPSALVRAHPLPRTLPAARIFILAVPDASIRTVASELASRLPPRSVVVHCAGARGPEELAPARLRGAAVAAMHPLVSFASRRTPPRLQGATFAIQGDARAVSALRRLVRSIGGLVVVGAELGPAYHASAALVANGAASLVHAGAGVLGSLGLSQRDAQRGLAQLLRSVADNIEQVGLPEALTGPVRRGDAATVSGHLQALRQLSPELLASYASVQSLILACARDAGLAPAKARAIQRALRASSPRTRRARVS
jgi:predicted short-subunit dehydrogenase-like oxidoreductase (DUF2520 family)